MMVESSWPLSAGEHALPQHSQADGNAGLRNQRQAKVAADFR